MKKRRKSLLTVLFTAALLVNLVPVSAGATEATATATVAPTAAATVAPTEAEAAASGAVTYSGSYNAYMGIQTNTKLWIFRNPWNDKDHGLGKEEFKGLSSVADGDPVMFDGTFTDAVVDGDGTYTVTLENPDFKDEQHLSLLFVSTDIPLSDQIKVTNVSVKFDGSTKYKTDVAYLDPDAKDYVKILLLNDWNKDVKDLFPYPFPPKKIEITFSVAGFGYQGTVAATPTVAPTAAPAADTAASTDAAATTSDGTAGGNSNLYLIISIIAAVVTVAVAVIVIVTKKKK